MKQKSIFEYVGEGKREEVVAIDWALKKPIIAYDGREITKFESIDDFKNALNTVVLCEEGVPHSLFTIEKPIMLVPGAIVKQKRNELGLEKSDENDAKTIYLLYQENPSLFRQLKERDINRELLRKKVKAYLRYEKMRIAAENMNRSLINEYGDFEDIGKINLMINMCKREEEKIEKDIEKILTAHFHEETRELLKIKGLSYILIAKLLAFIGDINRFDKPSQLVAYAGIAPGKGKHKGKDYNYSRDLQALLLGKQQICDEFIMKRVEPYRTIYDNYKKRLQNERPDESKIHIDSMARRKVADKFIKDVWRILKYEEWGAAERTTIFVTENVEGSHCPSGRCDPWQKNLPKERVSLQKLPMKRRNDKREHQS